MDKKLNVAIIGIGKWGKNLTEAFLRQGANIKYCFNKGSIENVKWLKEKHPDIELASSYEDILSDKTIDSIIVATPIKTHFEITKKALLAKKNVFLEKPGTETVEELEELKKLHVDNDLILTVGYIFVHHPVCTYIKKLLNNEKIISIHFEWNKWGSFGEDIILNLFSHEISLLKTFGIDIEEKTISFETHSHISEKDIVVFNAEGKNGEKITININRVSLDKKKTVTIKTNKNSYIWLNNELKIINMDQINTNIEVSNVPALDIEVANFISNIQNKNKPLVDLDFSIDVLKTTSFLLDSKHP